MSEAPKADVLKGSLDLLTLKALEVAGPMHGWGIELWIERVSGGALEIHQGTLYPALLRLLKQKWVLAKYGRSDNNRPARFYHLTPKGRRQLRAATDQWRRDSATVNRILRKTY
jgi:transcriptional regulator